jgi:GT2 family glycosyltransferase
MSRVTIVIVTYNSAGHIGACLTSLGDNPPLVEHETIVVDNASRDGTSELVRREWPDARVIEAGRNLGFAAANNLGIRQTSGELILLLNPDTVIPAGSIDALVACLDRRPDVAIVGPRLVGEDNRVEVSFGGMIAPFAELRQKVLITGHDRRIGVISAYVNRLTQRSREVDWVSGACLLVRRVDAEAVGLFDERFFMYTEDVDFCAAVRARGRTVLFEAGAEVRHLRGRSRTSAPEATAAAYRRSQIAFYGKHHPALVLPLRLYLKLRGVLPDTPVGPGP